MKKLLIALFAVSLLFAPVGVMAAPDEVVTNFTTGENVVLVPVVEESSPEGPVAPVLPEETKLPWMVVFLWPFISTAVVSMIKIFSDKLKKEAPPQLWPVLNMVIVALIVGIQTSDTPTVVIANVVAAVLAALGFTKSLDGATGKLSTITPALKAQLKAKGVIPKK
jgi:hypothetical protein